MILLSTITKNTKETEKAFLQRSCNEINTRAIESGQSLVNITPFKNSLITIWEISPNEPAKQRKPEKS